ncbi:MAG: GNAT family N-acetyltransferase [Chromatiales bacterium]|jgi:phosphinothricin acetyltransferase
MKVKKPAREREIRMIDEVTAADAEAIAALYNSYIRNSRVTFEVDPVSTDEMMRRIGQITQSYPWIAWREEGRLLGYAYLARFRSRAAYDHVAESSVYLLPDATGRGIGTALYRRLIELAPGYGISRIIGVIALPNENSERFHAMLGFKRTGVLEGVGRKFGELIDTAYWQLCLDAVKEEGDE